MTDAARADRSSFEAVFLDVPEHLDALSFAAGRLRSMTPDQFTEVSAETLEVRGVAPTEKAVSGRRSSWFSRARQPSCLAWEFEVYLPGRLANSRIQLWLCTDRTWALSSGPQVPTLMSISSFQPAALTSEHQQTLIDTRGARVAAWLQRPTGALNACVN